MKIITCPDECGYSDRLPNYRDEICKHPTTRGLICKDPNNFPKSCPLCDGIDPSTLPIHIQEILKRL